MRALPQLSALKLLVTEDFFSNVFLLYVFVSTEKVGSSIKASLHLECARFESQVDCYVQFFGCSTRILAQS